MGAVQHPQDTHQHCRAGQCLTLLHDLFLDIGLLVQNAQLIIAVNHADARVVPGLNCTLILLQGGAWVTLLHWGESQISQEALSFWQSAPEQAGTTLFSIVTTRLAGGSGLQSSHCFAGGTAMRLESTHQRAACPLAQAGWSSGM